MKVISMSRRGQVEHIHTYYHLVRGYSGMGKPLDTWRAPELEDQKVHWQQKPLEIFHCYSVVRR